MDLDLSAFTYEFEKDLNYEGIEMSDTSKFTLFVDAGETYQCGYIHLTEYFDLEPFDYFFDSVDLEKKFKYDKFLYIEEFLIEKDFRNEGIGNLMMNIFLTEIVPEYFSNYEIVVLFAEPFENNIQLKTLKKFYEKFGFKLMNIKQYVDPENPTEQFPPNNYMGKILK